MPVASLAGLTVIGLPVMFACEIQQRVEVFIGEEVNISSFSAIAAVRAALGDIFFAPETETPVSAIACLNPDFCFIYKHI